MWATYDGFFKDLGSFNDRTSPCNDHAAFSSGCGPYLVRMIHGKKARPIQKDGTLQRFLSAGWTWACTNRGSAVGRPARRFRMQ